MLKRVFVDVDDLWCREQIDTQLVPIKEAVPNFKITCYAIPNKLGPVHDLVTEFPWITFAQHGWEHTPFECRAWTQEEAETRLLQAQDMGYSLIFKPPNWVMDKELERACRALGVVLHHHVDYPLSNPEGIRQYPGPAGVAKRDHVNLHSHIAPNPVTDNISTHPGFKIERLKEFEEFLTINDVCVGGL